MSSSNVSETRQRAAKRALTSAAAPAARERTPSPRTPRTLPARRTRRRVGSSLIASACGDSEPESEDSTQQQQQTENSSSSGNDDDEEQRPSEIDTNSSAADAAVRTPDADTFSVISGDASPHGSVFDFLALGHADPAPFSLFTPSPGLSKLGLAASPRRPGSALSSPSRFFRSPFNASAAAQKKQRKRARPLSVDADEKQTVGNSSLLSGVAATVATDDAMALDGDDAETTDLALRTPAREPRSADASAKEEIPHLMDMMSLACSETLLSPWPRSTLLFAATPSPPSRVQLLSRRLKDDFDREQRRASAGEDDDAGDDGDDDEIYRSAPSGLAGAGSSGSSSSSDQDSFFAFANALSPLVHADEFESNFLSVRLSPLVSLDSYDLPRLIPPFPMPHLDDDENDDDAATRVRKSPANSHRSRSAPTPKTPLYRRATITNYSAGNSIGSGSSIRSDSMFPNIQASTSATPGKTERSKLGAHSIMTMKLHVAGGTSTLSHSKREIEAINNSLRKKSRKRKLEDKRGGLFKAAVPVQRKLLQTPLKTEPSHQPDAWSSPQSLPDQTASGRLGAATAMETPIKVEPRTPSYSVLSTHATPPRASVSAAASRFTVSTPVASSTLVMTPSSNWKKSRSMPPSGLTPGAGATPTPLGLRTRRTPPRRAASISTALPVSSAPSASSSASTSALETPHKTPVGTANASEQPLPTSTTAPAQSHVRAHDTAAAASVPASTATGAVGVAPAKPKRAPCNCKKSKCLKLYCECFASGGYCDESCNCQGCANTPAFEVMRQQAITARLEKNPNAFKPKIESTLGLGGVTPGRAHSTLRTTPPGAFATPVSGSNSSTGRLGSRSGGVKKMHKNGCHCKKSACQKKYCECFQAGVPCGDNCRCIDCKNQAPCASHAGGGTLSANATPSRLLSDVDETFVSPVLHNVRQRLRIDRETWAKNFSSPFEVSPRRERERTERFRSHLRTSTATPASASRPASARASTPTSSTGNLSFRVKAGSDGAATAFTTPTTGAAKRQKLSSVSPVAECTPLAAAAVATRSRAGGSKTQTLAAATPSKTLTHKAPLRSQTVSGAAPTDRVLLYPLFGDALPPVKRAVSAQIFHCLTNADLYNASLVSKLWSHVALGDAVWDHTNFVRAPATDEDAH